MAIRDNKRDHEYEEAWADAIASASSNFADVCDPVILDRLIKWKLGLRRPVMAQRTWHIEIKADFADEGRYEAIDVAVKMATVILDSKLKFGMDQGVKPTLAAWSDNFYGEHKDIDLWSAETGAANETVPDKVSDELIEAMREMQADKDK